MTITEKLLECVKKANANYFATYEENSMMNIVADFLPLTDQSAEGSQDALITGYALNEEAFNISERQYMPIDVPKPCLGFAYVEEFRSGNYGKLQPYSWNSKTTQVQVWFCKFAPLHSRALVRERMRNNIEEEIVKPFMQVINASGYFRKIDTFNWYTSLPRFDANEVSFMLEFNAVELSC